MFNRLTKLLRLNPLTVELKKSNEFLIQAAISGSIENVRLALEPQLAPRASTTEKGKEESSVIRDTGTYLEVPAAVDHIHRPEAEGKTALHYAIENQNLEMVEYLLEKGANPDYPTGCDGKTPLYLAVEAGNPQITTLLLDKGASINQTTEKNKVTPLYAATIRSNPEVLAQILGRDTTLDIDATTIVTDNGVAIATETALQAAARKGLTNYTRMLISQKANINLPDSRGKSAANYFMNHRSFTQHDIDGFIDFLLQQKRYEELAYFCQHNSCDLLRIKHQIRDYLRNYHDKEITEHINKVIQQHLHLAALTPQHPLGQILHMKRQGKTCNQTRGVLHEISSHLFTVLQKKDNRLVDKKYTEAYERSLSSQQINELLRVAARKGDIDEVNRLIDERGANANDRSYERGSALDEAIRGGHVTLAIDLIRRMDSAALSHSFTDIIKFGNIHVTNQLVIRYVELDDYKRLYNNLTYTRAHKPGTFFGRISAGLHLLDAIKSAKTFIVQRSDYTPGLADDARNRETYCGKIMHIARYGTECKENKGSLGQLAAKPGAR